MAKRVGAIICRSPAALALVDALGRAPMESSQRRNAIAARCWTSSRTLRICGTSRGQISKAARLRDPFAAVLNSATQVAPLSPQPGLSEIVCSPEPIADTLCSLRK